MLEKNCRLTKKNDFDAVWKKGRSSFDGLLGIKAMLNGLADSRVGIMIGLKVSKKAVERNRIKRIIREAIRGQAEKIPAGLDIVITVLPAARAQKASKLAESLDFNFKRVCLALKKK
jgi:ribonuclease P protein component